MAKDSFFIRRTLNISNTNVFKQASIDCGAYVSALGKSILRIHNVSVAFTDSGGRAVNMLAGAAAAQYQITTQSQGDIVLASDKSLICSGTLTANATAAGVPAAASHDFDIAPQQWTNGYLSAVETIYLGGAASSNFTDEVYVSVVLECTVETMSQSAAMALALSQQ